MYAYAERPRLCFVVTAPETASVFLNPHIEALVEKYEVTVVANFSSGGSLVTESARKVHIPIERKVHLLRDLRTLIALVQIFRSGQFEIVHSVTPKAGFLGITAAWIAGVPNRIHWYTGQFWVTRKGIERGFFKGLDRLIGWLTTSSLTDSLSQSDFLVNQEIIRREKLTVLGDGSICGVDPAKFTPNRTSRVRIRRELGISDDAIVFLFLGRLTRDKGVLELCLAYQQLRTKKPTHLVFVGPDEENLTSIIQSIAGVDGGMVTIVGQTSTPELFMSAADIFCMPSYREGFGLSVIEAAGCGIPCIASDIYGLSDAVQNGMTGLLFAPGDVDHLESCMQVLADDAPLRHRLGTAARSRVLQKFSQERITSALVEFYKTKIQWKKRSIVFGTTIPVTAASFLIGQMEHFRDEGWQVNLITSPGPEMNQILKIGGINVVPIPMERGPSLLKDLLSLVNWWWTLLRIKPDIVVSGTPKAGLIGMLAAWAVRTPTRIYVVRGLRLEGITGRLASRLGALAEYVACKCSTSVFSVSPSLCVALVQQHIVPAHKVRILGQGSSHGVDIQRFRPPSGPQKASARHLMGVKPDDMVVGFAGRLTPNKGINELVAAMASIVHLNPSLKLVLAGELDNTDPLEEADLQKMEQPWVLRLGKVTNMPEFYAALDIFCLPSHREGFPNVNLEAAATGLPIVTTSATGCVDSVRQGVDGIIVPPHDANELAHAIKGLIGDPCLRQTYGEHGRERVIKFFDESVMNDLLRNTINDLYESSKHFRKSKK